MLASDDLEKIKELLTQFFVDKNTPAKEEKPGKPCKHGKPGKSDKPDNAKKKDKKDGSDPKSCIDLHPSDFLVIAGLLTSVLEVNSILVDRDQAVEIVLTGTLKRPAPLDSIMQQVGQMPFEHVIKSILGNNM